MLVFHMSKFCRQIVPTPSSFHLPLLSLHPLFHTMSISVCKGHSGNREAAVDREINKQKKRERSDGGQSLVIRRVNYRPASQKHTPKLQSLWGVRLLLSLSVFVCMSLLFVFSALSLFFFSPSAILIVLSAGPHVASCTAPSPGD